MKMKIIPLIAVMSMLLATFSVIAYEERENAPIVEIAQKQEFISFSKLSFDQNDKYLSVDYQGANTFIKSEGKPMLPAYTKAFYFPRGTKINNVDISISGIQTEIIQGKIEPSPTAVSRITIKNSVELEEIEEVVEEDVDVYSSSELYPGNWYDYSIHSGLVNGEPSVILKVDSYPVRYSPAKNTVYKIDGIDIVISYEEPINQKPIRASYDLLIITPIKFQLALRPLVKHKEDMGVKTLVKSVESINLQYYSKGRDKAERLKLFIADTEANSGIRYVMLVGGLKSNFYANDHDSPSLGNLWWYLPTRYTHLDEGFISDLYYSDLYKYNETSQQIEFDDWDSDGDGIFAEYRDDIMDLYPDVYYGRLPCRNKIELRTVIDKIINYEKTDKADKEWFKRMIAVGGITFLKLTGPEYDGAEPDGEYLCNKSLDYMDSIIDEKVRIYASNLTGGPRPEYKDITAAFAEGAGFALLQGHGNAFMWDTKWPNATGDLHWVGGLMNFDMFRMTNDGKLPIVVVGGCHNGIFNVTFVRTLLDGLDQEWDYHAYGLPVRTCFSWKLVTQPRGGAIACTGSTGYGRGYPLDPLNLSGLLETNFFYLIGVDHVDTVGAAHSGSIQKYLDETIFHSSVYWSHAYVIGIFELFGDPSLKIGGYNTAGPGET